jgi:pentatricopeptide repeat protein
VTPAEALADIRGLARAGRVSYVRHAIERMDERGVTRNDVEHALMYAGRCAWQPRKESWKAFGVDLSGDELVVAVAIENGLLVVTVF